LTLIAVILTQEFRAWFLDAASLLRKDYTCSHTNLSVSSMLLFYSGADKSLARPGRKQATATEDFDFYISYLYRRPRYFAS
jgi:hypothetical protein